LKIKCFIVEDEEPAAELLAYFIKQHDFLQLEKIYHDNIRLPDEILDGSHLFFLDIEMPFRNGIDFLKQQQKVTRIPVILTTSHSQFGIEAYNLSVIDYLVKPFSKQRFDEAVFKAKNYFIANQVNKEEKFIWVNDNYKRIKIPVNTILFMESLKQYVKIYTSHKCFIILRTLKSFEEELEAGHFIRCHKSFLINKKHIKSFNRSVIIVDNNEIPIGKQFLKETLHYLEADIHL
jgi:DNA-binding LytR/AlgR family response regulator